MSFSSVVRIVASLLLSIIIAELCFGERAYAGFPTPEKKRLPITLEDAAALTVARWDFILEATVESSRPITVEYSGTCKWVTELWLRPRKQMWGEIGDQSFKVLTSYVKDQPLPPRNCGVLRDSDENPPPEVGEEGLFLLSSSMTIVDGIPALWSTKCGFLPRQPDGSVKVCILGLAYGWPYDDFVAAVTSRVGEISVESSGREADTIIIGRLGPIDSQMVEEKDDGTHFSLPVTVDRVVRGNVSENVTLGLRVVTNLPDSQQAVQDILAREMGEWMRTLASHQVVIFAHKKAITLVPVGVGVLKVSDGKIYQKQRRIEGGEMRSIHQPLIEMERSVK